MSGPGPFRRSLACLILLGILLGGFAPLRAGPGASGVAGGGTGTVICTPEGFLRIDLETGRPQAPARSDHCDLCVLCCCLPSASAAQVGWLVAWPRPSAGDSARRLAATARPFSSRAAPWSIAATRAPPLPPLS